MRIFLLGLIAFALFFSAVNTMRTAEVKEQSKDVPLSGPGLNGGKRYSGLGRGATLAQDAKTTSTEKALSERILWQGDSWVRQGDVPQGVKTTGSPFLAQEDS